ncbi:MAG TPA: hypothetical protein ENH86_00575 [Candidatus Jorgensenbacteria bacterium]|nr:hypothetical protein [Candidatus Jorgensenbacteria bacterium]
MKKIFLISLLALLLVAGTAGASHSWGKYHWDISTDDSIASPLELGDNLTSLAWDNSLAGGSSDWNLSVLRNQVVAGASNANCDPTSGRVEVCNGEYGNNGWLGVASIWVKRGRSGHIVQGVVMVNDTYFNTSPYDTQAWRNLVMCQEVGHTFGLGHQDEDFSNANLGTCMDYTNDPDGTLFGQLDNQHPNQHDLDMMTEIYAHLNSTDSGSGPGKGNGKGNGGGKGKPSLAGANIDLNDPSSWGQAIKQDAQGNNSLFQRDLENGQVLITHVIWAN